MAESLKRSQLTTLAADVGVIGFCSSVETNCCVRLYALYTNYLNCQLCLVCWWFSLPKGQEMDISHVLNL